MTKKIKFINIIIMSIMVIMFQTPIFANETTVKTSINQVDEDNRIKVEVSIQTLENIGEGINAYSGILKFNSKELNLIDIKSEGIWNTPVYNKETIETGEVKVVATTNHLLQYLRKNKKNQAILWN